MLHAILNVNGTIHPCNSLDDSNFVSVFDRSYLFGDSVYEVLRTYGGQPYLQAEHLDRLWQSARLLHFVPAFSRSLLEEQIQITLKQASNAFHDEVYLRIIVPRGVGSIGFAKQNIQQPTPFILIALPLSSFQSGNAPSGLRLSVVKRIRNHPGALNSIMKTGNYLNSLLATLEAQEQGFHDALLLDHQGFMTEGSTFNVFYVRRGIIATPPSSLGLLEGVTRKRTIELAGHLGIRVRCVPFTLDHFLEADELFVTSSIKEIFPVTQVDQRQYLPGPVTQLLAHAFQQDTSSATKGGSPRG